MKTAKIYGLTPTTTTGEGGGLNLYSVVRNDSPNRVDVLGTTDEFVEDPPLNMIDARNHTVNVGKCQIVILFGHGSGSNPWRWNAHRCSGGAALLCQPGAHTSGLGERADLWPSDLIEQSKTEPIDWRNLNESELEPFRSEGREAILAGRVLEEVYKNAFKRAGELCRNRCCKQIRVRFIWIRRGNESMKWLRGPKFTYNPRKEQTQYEGSIPIQDFVIDCRSWSYRYVER